MADTKVTVKELQDKVVEFRAKRSWSRNPKDLAIMVSVEANELLELFAFDKWQETDVDDEIKKEFADVMISCLEFASERGIDISGAVTQKLAHLEKKFPIETFGHSKATKEYHEIRKQYRNKKM